jgi:uncharacterized lipoprotein YajG
MTRSGKPNDLMKSLGFMLVALLVIGGCDSQVPTSVSVPATTIPTVTPVVTTSWHRLRQAVAGQVRGCYAEILARHGRQVA